MASKKGLDIKYSTRAEKEYFKLLDYLVDEFGSTTADKVDKKIEETLSIISHNPTLYPESKEKKGTRRCVLSKQTTIYYRVKKKNIEIVTLWSNKKNPTKKGI